MQPITLLLIEHDEFFGPMLKKAVQRGLSSIAAETAVVCVETPEDAKRVLDSQSVSLVVSDYRFSDKQTITGDLSLALKRRNVPVIIVSSHIGLDEIPALFEALRLAGYYKKTERDLKRLSVAVEQLLRGNVHLRDEALFRWIHLSDLHFGGFVLSDALDRRNLCRTLIKDVRSVARADAIFVTGDLAFGGESGHYAEAKDFFAELLDAAGLAGDRVYIVPGNHDVRRASAGRPEVRALHQAVRSDVDALDALLSDAKARKTLRLKMADFEAFLRKEFPLHPKSEADHMDWSKKLEIMGTGDRKTTIRLIGLSTVWISDATDGFKEGAEGVFLPNMAVCAQQLESTFGDSGPEEILIVLGHHPMEWLQERSREQLERRLAGRRALLVTGHVHKQTAVQIAKLGDAGAMIRVIGGAGYEPGRRRRGAQHTYCWGALGERDGQWQVGWAPRIYVAERNEMRPDRTSYDLDENGYTWQPTGWA
jgi:calcineurin-like phosphoesterase family protein